MGTDPEKIRLTPGSVSITSGVWPDPVTSIEPVYWGVGSDLFAYLVNEHRDGAQKHPTTSFIKDLVEHPGQVLAFDDARHWSERTVIMLCSQTTDTYIELYWDDDRLRSRCRRTARGAHPSRREVRQPAGREDGSREGALLFEIINRGASAHFVGGIPIGEQRRQRRRRPLPARVRPAGAARHGRKRHAGQPGVNPSLTITALVERAMSLWPNKTERDARPPLGSGYERVNPIMPRRPAVPAGAPGELRLDASQSDVIPEYPY